MKKVTTPKKTETLKSKPAIEPANYSVVMNSDELFSIIQLLSFSRDVFDQMSKNYAETGDEKSGSIARARSELSVILWNKFRVIANIGEPISRDLH